MQFNYLMHTIRYYRDYTNIYIWYDFNKASSVDRKQITVITVILVAQLTDGEKLYKN